MTSLASSGPPPRLDMQKQKQKKQNKKQKTKNKKHLSVVVTNAVS